jgi:hypothetical protein
MSLLLSLVLGLLLPSQPNAAPATRSAYVTAQDELWARRDLRDEANHPSFEQIFAAADATERQIRRDIAHIDVSLHQYRPTHRVAEAAIREGWLELDAWSDSTGVRKATLRSGGEPWDSSVSFYFVGGRPIARIEEAVTTRACSSRATHEWTGAPVRNALPRAQSE